MKPEIRWHRSMMKWIVTVGRALCHTADTEAQAQAWLEGKL